MFIARIILSSSLVVLTLSQVTNIVRSNPLLSRKKRYLAFPMKSNLVFSIALAKSLLRTQPKGWNTVVECDVPFPLPSDTKLFKKHKRTHHIQRRELLTGLEAALTQSGFDGKACLEQMICDAQNYVHSDSKSLTKYILLTIFNSTDINSDYRSCLTSINNCEFPLLNFILNSVLFA